MNNKSITVISISFACLLSACSFSNKHENIDSAAEAVKNGQYEEALVMLGNAEEAGEDPELLYRVKGIAEMELASYENATDDLLRSLSFNRGYVKEQDRDTSYYLAVAQYRNGDYEGAKSTYSAIIGLFPEDHDAFLQRGKTELRLGETDNAIADFNRAVTLNPNDPDLFIQIYECLNAVGMKDEGD
ncbi:MAG: tetratricopeptide repeat protein, partial [Lachnospiraceae bacterium]|nr:tetratricopeptide repeat protein [Lachnospiraceae bacterium]